MRETIDTRLNKVLVGQDAIEFIARKHPELARTFCLKVACGIAFLHSKDLSYGKILLKHLVLVLPNPRKKPV